MDPKEEEWVIWHMTKDKYDFIESDVDPDEAEYELRQLEFAFEPEFEVVEDAA